MSDLSNTTTSPSPGPATAEANRLRAMFEQAARTHLPAMAVAARALIRAWAEAEIAIQAARRSNEPGAADLPSAEAFRTQPFMTREEVSCERLTRWCWGCQPLSEDENDSVFYQDGTWFLPKPGTSSPVMILGERAEFDRVTYAESMPRVEAPLMIAGLSVPGILADDVPGWQSDKLFGATEAAEILARLDAIETGPASDRPERPHTIEYQYVRGAGRPQPPVTPAAA